MDPQVSSPSGVRFNRTSVSRLVVKLHSQYRCRLVRRTPCACSPAVYCSVLIVVVCESLSWFPAQSHPLLGVGGLSVLCCFLGAEWPNLPRVVAGSGHLLSCLRRV